MTFVARLGIMWGHSRLAYTPVVSVTQLAVVPVMHNLGSSAVVDVRAFFGATILASAQHNVFYPGRNRSVVWDSYAEVIFFFVGKTHWASFERLATQAQLHNGRTSLSTSVKIACLYVKAGSTAAWLMTPCHA